MIVAISIVKGFQKEIKDKVVNFSSHFQITAGGNNFSFENTPIIKSNDFIQSLSSENQIKHVQTFATKPGLIQSRADTQFFDNDKIKIIRDIEGVIFKGISTDFNWEFLSKKIIEGKNFNLNNNKTSDSILISKYLSNKLKLEVNSPIACYFIKDNGPRLKKFYVAGIYETGLEEFDKQFAFIDIKHIQKLNNWGIQTNLFLEEQTNKKGELTINSITSGGTGNYLYDWGDGYSLKKDLSFIPPSKDTVITLVVKDYQNAYDQKEYSYSKYRIDTSQIQIKTNSPYDKLKLSSIYFEYEPIDDNTRLYKYNNLEITTFLKKQEGSSKHFIGGYEVFINDFDKIDNIENFIYLKSDPLQKITKITTLYTEIFGWLDILDTNVIVIIILMILVSIINIISLMLVLIIERSNMIGLLKSFGAYNFTIQKIFVSLGGYILFRGLIIGNIIAILLIVLQNKFGILKLPQENYYLNEVPMSFETVYFIFINLFTIIICFTILFLISLFISTIKPIKSIKFE